MSKEYMDTQVPMRAPGPEDSDALKQDLSQRVDVLQDPVGNTGERGPSMDIPIDDPVDDEDDADRHHDPDDPLSGVGDAIDDGLDDLREGIDDVSEQVSRVIHEA